jgi:two-component system, chemotaxis family, CheB/CheR fusion protein
MPQEKPKPKRSKRKKNDGLPALAPDHIEQDEGDQFDNVIPTRGYHSLPIVGIGGSAGSYSALQKFFQTMPEKPWMAFVVVLHLSPEHESTMPAIIAKWTKMRVMPARDGIKVEPNCVYVIPAGKHLSSSDSPLRMAICS